MSVDAETIAYLSKLAKKRGIDDPKQLLAVLTDQQKDLAVACFCGAPVGVRCRRSIQTHFGRRLRRLLVGLR